MAQFLKSAAIKIFEHSSREASFISTKRVSSCSIQKSEKLKPGSLQKGVKPEQSGRYVASASVCVSVCERECACVCKCVRASARARRNEMRWQFSIGFSFEAGKFYYSLRTLNGSDAEFFFHLHVMTMQREDSLERLSHLRM